MPTTLNPAPADIGLGSPVVGPWFYNQSIAGTDIAPLPAPDADLGVTLTIPQSYEWLPPAQGVLSVYVASTPRPRLLEPLRKPDGTPAFNDDHLVALFTLLPETAARLYDLSSVIPSPDSKASTAPTRPRVRYIAMELPELASQPASFNNFFGRFPFISINDGPIVNADALGLLVDPAGNLRNTDEPMTDLFEPGAVVLVGNPDPLLFFAAATQVTLSAFDDAGWPIDPGAVAEWWRYMAVQGYSNLWAPVPNAARTVAVTGAYTALLTNAHGGALDGPVAGRLTTANAATAGPILTRNAGGNGIAFSFSAAPAVDDAPLARVAVLPHGTFGTTLKLWDGSPPLTRDYCRVVALDVEHHLLGERRTAAAGAADSVTRRAADQNDPLRRTEVNRCGSGAAVLHASTGAALDALFSGPLSAAPAAGAQARLVAPVLDSDWGTHAPVTSAAALPSSLPDIEVDALIGGDATPKRGQRVLMRMKGVPAGAWVRAWPLGFDFDEGVHRALDGGGGRAGGPAGDVALVATLPMGQGTGKLGVSLMLTTASGSRIYNEQRFARPAEKHGSPANINAAGANDEVLLCEQGLTVTVSALGGQVAAGTTLVLKNGSGYALVDRATLAQHHFAPNTLVARANNQLTAELTQPAFRNQPVGQSNVLAATNGVSITERNGFVGLLTPGQPLPGQERLDVAYSLTANGSAHAYVGSAPALGSCGEILPHQSGHAGAPAGVEVHGTGAVLDTLAASAVGEFTLDRVMKSCISLVAAAIAAPALPAAAAAPSRWAAVLKTVATGVEGEFGMLASTINYAGYPFTTGKYTDVQAWYNSQMPVDQQAVMLLPPVGAGSPGEKLALRAMHRRVRTAGWGRREAATSLQAAFSRAEQLVYIETPALDMLDVGKVGAGETSFDTVNPIATLIARAKTRPRLRLILCLPVRPLPGYPKGYDKIRLSLLAAALDALRDTFGAARLAAFTPSAGAGQRTVRLASTSVIVDDVYALTGSTHLSRRGLSHDSSLSVAVFDDVLEHGAPREVRNFRRALIAGRLGVPPRNLPDDPRALIELVQALNQSGSARIDSEGLPPPPDDSPKTADIDAWNPEGSSFAESLEIISWLETLMMNNQSDEVT